eukprot:m.83119 g.83119  ORF g.83119 m.83119 type:complete len:442 (-) comp14646_c0_seq6:270-1595(-)
MTTVQPLVLKLGESVNPMVADVLHAMGWRLHDEAKDAIDGWNLYWRTNSFTSDEAAALKPWQRINSFPRSHMITKKDALCRAMRKMQRVYGNAFNFNPEGYVLPADKDKFVAAYDARQAAGEYNTWICKPAELSRGRGIFIFQSLDDLTYDRACVVQAYLERPLTLLGYKFDLRLYVLVTSFKPLTVYMYKKGLARFGTAKYDTSDMTNLYSHLTNTSINKFSPTLEAQKDGIGAGCKWSLIQLRQHWQAQGFDDRNVWRHISNLVTHTLLALVDECPVNSCCRELFGFDVLLDENRKPHLLEVNFGPALGLDTPQDRDAKIPLIQDVISSMNYSDGDGAHAPSKNPVPLRVQKARDAGLTTGDMETLNEVHPQSIGDFHRTFPFNSTTLKAAYKPRPDLRVIVKEIRRASKAQGAILKQQHAQGVELLAPEESWFVPLDS